MNSEVPSYSKVPEMSQYNANVFQNLVGHLNVKGLLNSVGVNVFIHMRT